MHWFKQRLIAPSMNWLFAGTCDVVTRPTFVTITCCKEMYWEGSFHVVALLVTEPSFLDLCYSQSPSHKVRHRHGCWGGRRQWTQTRSGGKSRADVTSSPPPPPLDLAQVWPITQFYSVRFWRNYWFAWRANQWPLIGKDSVLFRSFP